MNTHATPTTRRRTKWGLARFGTNIPAIAVAIPIGVVVAALIGSAAAWITPLTGSDVPSPLLLGVIVAICTFPATLGLTYAVVIDRATLVGATDRPEESVESQWYTRAAAGALSDVVLVVGLAAFISAFIPTLEVRAYAVFAGVILLAAISCTVRYLVQRRRG